MKLYNVVWEIDIQAKSPRDAARQALEIMQDKESTANVFKVANDDDLETTDLSE